MLINIFVYVYKVVHNSLCVCVCIHIMSLYVRLCVCEGSLSHFVYL